MTYSIIFAKAATLQLGALYTYIADAASPSIAAAYTEEVLCYCLSLQDFPHRGTMRDDVRLGLRITHYKKRTIIAFSVDESLQRVFILGLFYGGQNFSELLQGDAGRFEHD